MTPDDKKRVEEIREELLFDKDVYGSSESEMIAHGTYSMIQIDFLLSIIDRQQEEIEKRTSSPLQPIMTYGGHGYSDDDDDEDYWCPICHKHLGTHTGFDLTCVNCGQLIDPKEYHSYTYFDMKTSQKQIINKEATP